MPLRTRAPELDTRGFHLATRIPALDRMDDPSAWHGNDRLRSEGAPVWSR